MAFDSELLTDREIQILRRLTMSSPERCAEMFKLLPEMREPLVMELFSTICEQRATLEAVKEFARGQ